MGGKIHGQPSTFLNNLASVHVLYRDKKHVEWSRAFLKLLADLEEYILQHHTGGITWNSKVG